MTAFLMADDEAVVAEAQGVIRRAADALRREQETPEQARQRRLYSALRWLAIAAVAGLVSSIYFAWYVQRSQEASDAETRCRAEFTEALTVADGRLTLASRAESSSSGAIFRQVLAQAITQTPTDPDTAAELVQDFDDAVLAASPAVTAYEHALEERDGATAACAADDTVRPTPPPVVPPP